MDSHHEFFIKQQANQLLRRGSSGINTSFSDLKLTEQRRNYLNLKISPAKPEASGCLAFSSIPIQQLLLPSIDQDGNIREGQGLGALKRSNSQIGLCVDLDGNFQRFLGSE